MIRVAIYAASAEHARQLAKLLAEDDRLEIVCAATLPRSFERSPLSDVVLAAGLRAEELFGTGPPVVLLTPQPPRQSRFTGAIRAWLPADVLPAEISAAIVAAAQDFTVLTPEQSRRWLKNEFEEEQSPPAEALTPRELQVLHMLAHGLGNKQIAAQLAISDHTAKFHVAQILAKLRAGSRAEAVAIGMRRGLVPI